MGIFIPVGRDSHVSGTAVAFQDSQSLMALYRDVLAVSPRATLDRSLTPIDYLKHRPGAAIAKDGKIQSSELFHAIAETRRYDGAYRRFAGEALPWTSAPTRVSQQLRSSFDRMAAEYRRDHGLKKGGKSLGLAKEIFAWVLRPRSQDGFGMRTESAGPERSFQQLLRNPRGDCNEHTFALIHFLSRAGYSVHPEWVGRTLKGKPVEHVVAALEWEGRRYLLDGTIGKFNAPYTDHTPMSRRELLAWYWNNRGKDAASSDPKLARRYYQRALQIDPRNPYLHLSLGVLYLKHFNDAAKAEARFKQALRLAPGLSKACQGLGDVHFERRDYSQAEGYYRRAVAGDSHNVSARKRLIQSLIGIADKGKAGRELASFSQYVETRRPDLELGEYARLKGWISSQRNIIATL